MELRVRHRLRPIGAVLCLLLVAAVTPAADSPVEAHIEVNQRTIHPLQGLGGDAWVSTEAGRRITAVEAYVRPPGPPAVAPEPVPVEAVPYDGAVDGRWESFSLGLDSALDLHAGHNLLCITATDNGGSSATACTDFFVVGDRVEGFGNADADNGINGSLQFLASRGHAPQGGFYYRVGSLGLTFRSTEVEEVRADTSTAPATGLVRGEGALNEELDCDFRLEVVAGGLSDGTARYDLLLTCGPLNAVTYESSGSVEGFVNVQTVEY